MMKLVVVLFSCLVFASGNSISKISDEIIPQKIEYSDAAKVELEEAALIALDYLCIRENVLPEIMNTVCARAMKTGVGSRSTYSADASHYACTDCSIADPICFESCPQ